MKVVVYFDPGNSTMHISGLGPGQESMMLRSEMAPFLAEQHPEWRPEVIEQVLDIFFDEIAQRLAEGGRVELRGFGAFSVRERGARIGRNPRTGSAVEVLDKRVPFFKPGKEMRERLEVDQGTRRPGRAPRVAR